MLKFTSVLLLVATLFSTLPLYANFDDPSFDDGVAEQTKPIPQRAGCLSRLLVVGLFGASIFTTWYLSRERYEVEPLFTAEKLMASDLDAKGLEELPDSHLITLSVDLKKALEDPQAISHLSNYPIVMTSSRWEVYGRIDLDVTKKEPNRYVIVRRGNDVLAVQFSGKPPGAGVRFFGPDAERTAKIGTLSPDGEILLLPGIQKPVVRMMMYNSLDRIPRGEKKGRAFFLEFGSLDDLFGPLGD